MTDYQSALLKLLSKALFGKDVDLPYTDWALVLKEAKNQAVTQLIYSVLDKAAIPDDVRKEWDKAAAFAMANNVLCCT